MKTLTPLETQCVSAGAIEATLNTVIFIGVSFVTGAVGATIAGFGMSTYNWATGQNNEDGLAISIVTGGVACALIPTLFITFAA